MTNFKGTKGKWVFDDEDIFSLDINEIPTKILANNPKPYSSDEWEANALLISKAPEMLEMLEHIVKKLDGNGFPNLQSKIQQLIKESTEL